MRLGVVTNNNGSAGHYIGMTRIDSHVDSIAFLHIGHNRSQLEILVLHCPPIAFQQLFLGDNFHVLILIIFGFSAL